MARFNGAENAAAIYAAAEMFRARCLETDGSLLSAGASIWNASNLEELRKRVPDDPKRGDESFLNKLKSQLHHAHPDVTRLAAEALSIYFLFPSKVGSARKHEVVNTVLGWIGDGERVNGGALSAAFASGLGGTGQGYNTRRPDELGYLVRLMLAWKQLAADKRAALLADPWGFREFAVKIEDGASRQLRHILLHLLFPNEFERIGSARQKAQLLAVFNGLCEQKDANEDQQLLAIREALAHVLDTPSSELDFYREPLAFAWGGAADADADAPTVELLKHKRQIVLYGPPGTGKTYEAKRLARELIHAAAFKKQRAEKYFRSLKEVDAACEANIHRLQLHPAYSYEDFVRGLHIAPGGATEYRPGRLLKLIEEMNGTPRDERLPHVLILDEMNRTDLSRMLGECFSLLENRDEAVELPGHRKDGSAMTLTIPDDLYIIGTMNLIDQSVEQLDFALRRRFLWFYRGFDPEAFLTAAEARWTRPWNDRKQRFPWRELAEQFGLLADAATELNKQIAASAALGPQYEIGHTYLLDVVEFLREALSPQGRSLLWHQKDGKPLEPVRQLWRLSLQPLLEQYLGGLSNESRSDELARLEDCFLRPRTAAR